MWQGGAQSLPVQMFTSPLPHLHREGLGSPLPHLHLDYARLCYICGETHVVHMLLVVEKRLHEALRDSHDCRDRWDRAA